MDTLGNAIRPGPRASDHVPILIRLTKPVPVWPPRIPTWIARDHEFTDCVAETTAHIPMAHMHAWVALDACRQALHDAARMVRSRRKFAPSFTPEGNLHFLILGLRALHLRDVRQINLALRGCVDCRTAVNGIAPDILQSTALRVPVELIHRLQERVRILTDQLSNRAHQEHSKSGETFQRTHVMKTLSLIWKRTHRTIGRTSFCDDEGRPYVDQGIGLRHALGYWASVFSETETRDDCIDRILNSATEKIELPQLRISKEEFFLLLRSRPESALGPDGIPYSAWIHSTPSCHEVLFRVYTLWADEGCLPKGFNVSWLWLLPKGTLPSDTPKSLPHSFAGFRPLSGANTCAKVLPAAAYSGICSSSAAERFVHPDQRGFVKGRPMLQHIAELECHAYNAMQCGNARAVLLFDFTTAFPSVSQKYIFAALRHIGFPSDLIRCLTALFRDNYHYFKYEGTVVCAFRSTSGVRQGCPISALLFAMISDPLLRFFYARL